MDTISQNDKFLNIAAYKFARLTNLAERRALLKERTHEWGLGGTILLSEEGINLVVAGLPESVSKLVELLQTDSEIGALDIKESTGHRLPFKRMLIKLKKQIISMRVPGIDPQNAPSAKISPKELRSWLDEGKPLVLLDVRNDYEVRLGTFENAIPIGVHNFKHFPEAVEKLPQDLKETPVVMFCTGGIRCEKAGPFMQQAGYQNIFQLDGGILRYFEECGQAHYTGECFVFDRRVALDANLKETSTVICYACLEPLTTEEQQSPLYVYSEQCPYCAEK